NGAYIRPTSGGAAVQLGAAVPWDIAPERGVLCTTYAAQLAAFPLQAGPPRKIETGLARTRWARWCAGDALVAVGTLGDRPARVWRFDGTLTPLTAERVVGLGAVSPDGRTLALIADDRLLVIEIAGAQQRHVAGDFHDELVCGWSADGRGVLVRSKTLPIQIRRVDLATGSSSSVVTITPPPVGLRGVSAVVTSLDATAYAYSYGQELSRLYSMTTEQL
ncbi:MAG TPA: hypothetical protein VIV11_33920, partial [Kofleriaceae bacterium]